MLGNAIALIAIAAMFGLESYKVKDRLPRLVLGALAVIFVVSGLTIEAIATRAPEVGSFLTELFEQPISWFILLMALFLVLRPYWTNESTQIQLKGPSNSDFDLVRNEVAEIQQLIASMNEKVPDEIATALKGVQSGALADIKELRSKVSQAADSELPEIRKGCFSLSERVEKLNRSVNERFYALNAMNLMDEIEQEMAGLEAFLCSPSESGQVLDAALWLAWEADFASWEALLKRWLGNAKWYAFEPEDRIFEIKDEKYDEEMGLRDDQFFKADHLRKFKRFMILRRQWQAVRDDAHQGISRFAYQGHSIDEIIQFSRSSYSEQIRIEGV